MAEGRSIEKRKTSHKTVEAVTPRRITRGMTTDAARKAVFETPELLENIMSFLPATVILTKVQRLSHAWKAAVHSSPAIRTKLWLQPQSQTAIQPVGFTDGYMSLPVYSCVAVLNSFCSQGVRMDPFSLKADTSSWSDSTGIFGGRMAFQYSIHLESQERSGQSAFDSCQSWRDMCLTDPPATTGVLRVCCYSRPKVHDSRLSVVDTGIREHKGITTGLLHDVCSAILQNHHDCSDPHKARSGVYYHAIFTILREKKS